MMKIGFIGAGRVAEALGQRWASYGHEIMFGVRDVQSQKIQDLLALIGSNVQASSVEDAGSFGEVIVLATPWNATQEALQNVGNLQGKILIDCTNPVAPQLAGLSIGQTTSAAEEIAKWVSDAQVVKAFNITGSGNMIDPKYDELNADMFICGDDNDSKAIVKALAEEIGFDVIDVGHLSKARLLEPLAMLWIHLAYVKGMGPNIAFKLMRR